jgi:hypothetical protein
MNRADADNDFDNDSAGTGGTDELIDRLLDNYKIEFRPEVRFKFKKQ